MEAKYLPVESEAKINQYWIDQSIGAPRDGGEAFSLVLPPPNATGELHLGHALMITVQDIMARYQRLQGKSVVWVPGTDHAAIATQAKVEKMLPAGQTRHTLGRAEFLQRVHDFVAESQETIRSQIKIMGASLDWSRERYTLGPDESELVKQVFVKMYHDGLIYRGQRVINWDPKSQSAIADDEVVYQPEQATLYYLQYTPDIVVATSQPETKLGDTAIAVNPNDERYQKYLGQELNVDLAGHKITVKVIADESIEMDFGSGVLGVTPAHSMTDYLIGQKHHLNSIQLYDESGLMLPAAGKYVGLNILDARAKFLADLESAGQLIKTETYERQVPTSERSGAVILNIPSNQWFVSVDKPFNSPWGRDEKAKSLKQIALEVVANKSIVFVPERFERVYERWLNNMYDWCISRQIWFGHRIPAYYSSLGNTFVGLEAPADTEQETWTQDSDSLDTWFSSGMWTFSCFLLPWHPGENLEQWINRSREKGDLGRFHPTSVLETGYDIIFFWVARMILLTTYVMGEVPFKKVYLHGLVRDLAGRKFSKSLGNGIDPRQTAIDFGADATRLALILGSTPGNDTKISVSKIEGYRNYITKLWNLSRFLLGRFAEPEKLNSQATLADQWILSRLQSIVAQINLAMEQDRLSDAGLTLYDFVWHEMADWYAELIKIPEFYPHPEVLEYLLRTVLILQHPFTPFVTEAIWQEHWSRYGSLAKYSESAQKNWPISKNALIKSDLESQFKIVFSLIERIRFQRSERKFPAAEILPVEITFTETNAWIKDYWPAIKKLARIDLVTVKNQPADVFISGFEIFYTWPIEAVKDNAKEIEDLRQYAENLTQRLNDSTFIQKAPPAIVEKERLKLQQALDKLAKLSKE